jgi:hypothetical protein
VNASSRELHAGGAQHQIVDVRHTTGAVDDRVGIDEAVAALVIERNAAQGSNLLDRAHLGAEADFDAGRARARHEAVDQIRIELHERPPTAMQDRDAGTGSSRHVREFE